MIRMYDSDRPPAVYPRCAPCLQLAESFRLEGEVCPECDRESVEPRTRNSEKVLNAVVKFALHYKTTLKAPAPAWLAALDRIWSKLDTIESGEFTDSKLQAATDGIWLFALCCRRIDLANGQIDEKSAQRVKIICDVLDILLQRGLFVGPLPLLTESSRLQRPRESRFEKISSGL